MKHTTWERNLNPNGWALIGKVEPKWLDPYTIIEVKGSGGYIVRTNILNNENVVLIDQINLYINETLRPGNKIEICKMTMLTHLHPVIHLVYKYPNKKVFLTAMQKVTVK